jgi:hypothetical protein
MSATEPALAVSAAADPRTSLRVDNLVDEVVDKPSSGPGATGLP